MSGCIRRIERVLTEIDELEVDLVVAVTLLGPKEG
jgi:hypothetical protein